METHNLDLLEKQGLIDNLTEKQKVKICIKIIESCDRENLSFAIGKRFNGNPLDNWKIKCGYFTYLLDLYDEEDPKMAKLFWPHVGFKDLDQRFKKIMEKHGYASENGHADVVDRLLEDPRVDPSARANYALRYASKNGHLDVVDRLLEDPRVDRSADNYAAIKWARKNNHPNVVERLRREIKRQ